MTQAPSAIAYHPSSYLKIGNEHVRACPCGKGVERWAYVDVKYQANHYKSLHSKAQTRAVLLKKALAEAADVNRQKRSYRERKLLQELVEAKAEIILLKKKLFGKSSEVTSQSEKATDLDTNKKSARGQQRGSKGHGRRKQPNLVVREEFIELSESKQKCQICQLPFKEISSTEDSEMTEIEVRAHIRKIRRKKYLRHSNCQCPGTKKIITASAQPSIISHSRLGISVWVMIILNKFEKQIPNYRTLNSLKWHGVSLAQGTITGGLKKLLPLFSPAAEAVLKRCQQDTHWHADETRWEVFEKTEGKKTYRWYLWVFRGKEAVYYTIEPTRGYAVPERFFKDSNGGILNCDRYVVYKVLADKTCIVIALCWAHVRRDFLDVANAYPNLCEWARDWLDDIRELYQANKLRMEVKDDTGEILLRTVSIKEKIEAMKIKLDMQLELPDFNAVCQKVLVSLRNHWEGLTVFVDNPHIPMDNNLSERSLRNSVVGRKNYYGSGSIWSSQLAAMMFTLLETLKMSGINTHAWLTYYLKACAENNGNAPIDLSPYLPWMMTEEQRAKMMRPIPDG